MSRVLVLRHHLEDRPGLVGDALESRGLTLDVRMMDEDSATPSVEGYDLLIILGSKHSVYDPVIEEAWFGRELDVLADAEQRGVPVFGICFGAQALCRYFGGVVELSENPEVGWFDVDEVGDSGVGAGPWFEYHFDACSLPASAQVWATNPRAVQAFAIGRNVGVQFHPEIDEHQLGEWMKAGGEEDTRQLGIDPVELVAQTARETPEARARVDDLVELVLRHTGVATSDRG
ncbi:MAG TPA: type 1 glutamine amidotransferase [Acidimicrobiales bacterium]|nr:type 1 glutamine amidotransferase [Acidimicrobiales bacterium]